MTTPVIVRLDGLTEEQRFFVRELVVLLEQGDLGAVRDLVEAAMETWKVVALDT